MTDESRRKCPSLSPLPNHSLSLSVGSHRKGEVSTTEAGGLPGRDQHTQMPGSISQWQFTGLKAPHTAAEDLVSGFSKRDGKWPH